MLGHLDTNLVFAIAKDLHLVNGRYSHQFITNFESDFLSRIGIQVSGYRQKYDVNRNFLFVYNRFLGERRKCRNRVNLGLHLGQYFVDVLAGCDFDRDIALALKGA